MHGVKTMIIGENHNSSNGIILGIILLDYTVFFLLIPFLFFYSNTISSFSIQAYVFVTL